MPKNWVNICIILKITVSKGSKLSPLKQENERVLLTMESQTCLLNWLPAHSSPGEQKMVIHSLRFLEVKCENRIELVLWIQLGPSLAVVDVGGVNQWMQ